MVNNKHRVLLLMMVALINITKLFAQSQSDYESFCGDANNLLNYVDRANIAPSPCMTPKNRLVVEGGYQLQELVSNGSQYNIPEMELQLGLPGYFEIEAFLPNYYNQSIYPKIGFGPTSLGLKHPLWFNNNSMFTLNETITFESGSNAYGSAGTGGSVIGILSHNISSEFNLTGTLGYGLQYTPMQLGGNSYTSFSPDLLLSWTNNRILLFGEIYGQNTTGPNQGSGFNFNTGVLYLLKNNMTIDCEYNQSLHGNLGGWKRYVGFGVSFLIL